MASRGRGRGRGAANSIPPVRQMTYLDLEAAMKKHKKEMAAADRLEQKRLQEHYKEEVDRRLALAEKYFTGAMAPVVGFLRTVFSGDFPQPLVVSIHTEVLPTPSSFQTVSDVTFRFQTNAIYDQVIYGGVSTLIKPLLRDSRLLELPTRGFVLRGRKSLLESYVKGKRAIEPTYSFITDADFSFAKISEDNSGNYDPAAPGYMTTRDLTEKYIYSKSPHHSTLGVSSTSPLHAGFGGKLKPDPVDAIRVVKEPVKDQDDFDDAIKKLVDLRNSGVVFFNLKAALSTFYDGDKHAFLGTA